MKAFLISVICAAMALPAFAAGENVATSKAFVDTVVALKQDKIPANSGTTQVLTNTGTAGNVGTKNVYDSTATYSDQTDALVDAVTMNTAVQNAINAEFKCVQYNPNDPNDCWLVDIFGSTGKSTLPTGYTELEYLESTGEQYIDTGITINDTYGAKFDFQYTNTNSNEQILFGVIGPNTVLFRIGDYMYFAHKTGTGYTCASTDNTRIGRHLGTINYMNDKLITIDGNTRCSIPNATFSNPSNFYLFTSNYPSGGGAYHNAVARIYNFKLSENTSIVHDYVPAQRDSDGTLGMYDIVTNTFLTNSGNGNFIAGPVQNLYLPSNN